MFPSRPTIRKANNVIRSAMETKYGGNSLEYVLGYEDKDGDLLLLVEDVPWRLFVQTVKRLRLMRRFEPHGKQLKINSDIITSCEKLKLLGDGPGQKEDLPNQFVKVYAHGVLLGSAMETKYGGNSSDYVLGYEDKDGDLLLLVEDVPCSFFVQTVKRLRLMRRFESHGHG